MKLFLNRLYIGMLTLALLITSVPCHALNEVVLPMPGARINLSTTYAPALLKGIKVHPDDPFKFEFVLQKGTGPFNVFGDLSPSVNSEANKLIKYFLASLTVPEKDLWVNLSPYEKTRIVPESFGQTEMGRDLLAQDYILKQITSSLMHPENAVGKKFWNRVYEEAAKKYGTINIPINTFNKVWIVPDKAVVYENAKAGTAYVVESKLKVMLEQDYLSASMNETGAAAAAKQSPQGAGPVSFTQQFIKEIIIPELNREINKGQHFARLRQVYHSLILATWYKKKIKDSILNQIYSDKNKINGVTIADPNEKQKIYQQYLQAFKKGAYNLIKEEKDPATGRMIPRKYFSGGFSLAMTSMFKTVTDQAMVKDNVDSAVIINVDIKSNRDAAINASMADIWPLKDFDQVANYLFKKSNVPYQSLYAQIWGVEIAVKERGSVRFRSMADFVKKLLFLFPQFSDEINQWEASVVAKNHQSNDEIALDKDLRGKLARHLEDHIAQWVIFAHAFDFMLKFSDFKTVRVGVVQDYVNNVDSLDNFEDEQIKKEVMGVIDQLAQIYGLSAEQVDGIKKKVLVVKGKNVENVDDQTRKRVLGLFTLLVQLASNQMPYPLAEELEMKGKKIDEVLKELMTYMDIIPGIADAVVQEYLSQTESSRFRGAKEDYHKDLVMILPENGREGIISEVGHLFLSYLSGVYIEDSSVHEIFDALARIAMGTKVADYYQMTGLGFYERLKAVDVDTLHNKRLAQLNDLIELRVIERPTKENNKTAALMGNPELVKKMLIDIVGKEQAEKILEKDSHIVSHSLGVYMARRMIERAGSPQQAIAIAKIMLTKEYKGFLNDYEEFEKEFERILAQIGDSAQIVVIDHNQEKITPARKFSNEYLKSAFVRNVASSVPLLPVLLLGRYVLDKTIDLGFLDTVFSGLFSFGIGVAYVKPYMIDAFDVSPYGKYSLLHREGKGNLGLHIEKNLDKLSKETQQDLTGEADLDPTQRNLLIRKKKLGLINEDIRSNLINVLLNWEALGLSDVDTISFESPLIEKDGKLRSDFEFLRRSADGSIKVQEANLTAGVVKRGKLDILLFKLKEWQYEKDEWAAANKDVSYQLVFKNLKDPQVRRQWINVLRSHDAAQIGQADPKKGGIDFNADKLNLDIKNSGQGIEFKIDQAMLEQLRNTTGFTPEILNIQPMTDLKVFLGIAT